jgi:recombinational DNA repair protein RecR
MSENCNGCEGCLALDKDEICEDCIENDRNSKELVKNLFENVDKSIESLQMSIANVEVIK